MSHFRILVSAAFAVALSAWMAAAQTVPASPDDGGPRRFEVRGVSTFLNLREQPSLGAPVAGRLAPGTILTNLGCRAEGLRVWCHVQDFRGGPVGFADASFLAPAIAPHGAALMGPDTSALRAGQGEFDATGFVPCAQQIGQPMMQCPFGVARAGGGDATVVITRPDGATRAIFFTHGIAMGADSSEAEPASFRFVTSKESDLHLIRVGDERYEIPEAVIFGG